MKPRGRGEGEAAHSCQASLAQSYPSPLPSCRRRSADRPAMAVANSHDLKRQRARMVRGRWT